MSDIFLTQQEADFLLFRVVKQRINDTEYDYPMMGGALSIPLLSEDKKNEFTLDISRGHIDILKGKYQTRGYRTIILARLDFGGSPHRNPDDTEISSPHLHLYREGYGSKWAIAVPTVFSNLTDLWQTLDNFMDYCLIRLKPKIKRGLFV